MITQLGPAQTALPTWYTENNQWAAPRGASAALMALTNQNFYGAGGQAPTKLWRSDFAPDSVWPGASVGKPFFLGGATVGAQITARTWHFDITQEIGWLSGPTISKIVGQHLATQVPRATFYAPRPQAQDQWLAQPTTPANALAATTTVGTPVGGMWMPDPAEVTPWYWTPFNPQTQAVKPGVTNPFSRLWHYDFAVEAVWQGAPTVDVVLADLSAKTSTPVKQWRRFDVAYEIGWPSSPSSAAALAALTVGGMPLVGMFAPEPTEVTSWTWAPHNTRTGVAQPFSKAWRYDIVPEPGWLGKTAPIASPIIADLASQPFSKFWRYDLAEQAAWLWVPPNGTLNEPPVGEPFNRQWRWDNVPDPSLNLGPAQSPILADFYTQPFAKEWTYNFIEQPSWAWTPPNGTLNEPLVGEPFYRQWRWDVVPTPDWLAAPVATPILPDFSGTPFAKAWHYDLAELTSWLWVPPNGTLNEPFVGEPFYQQWRYDLVPDPAWLAAPVKAPVIADLTAGGTPFEKLWHYDFVPEPPWGLTQPVAQPPLVSYLTVGGEVRAKFWRWDYVQEPPQGGTALVASPIIQAFSTEPFSRLWRYDLAVEAVWQGNPEPAFTLEELEYHPRGAFYTVGNLAPETAWAWAPPPVTPNPTARLPVLWRHNLVGEPGWLGSPSAAAIIADLYVMPFSRRWSYDPTPETAWLWTPPNGLIHEPQVGQPFYRQWRYDLAPETAWSTVPTRAFTLAALSSGGSPIAGLWALEPAGDPTGAWYWTQQTTTLKSIAPKTLQMWRHALGEDGPWQWHPSAVPAPVVGTEPFYQQWRYDLAELTAWGWGPSNPVLANLSTQPFSRLWRYDPAEATPWAQVPPNLVVALPAVPFSARWSSVASELGWQGSPSSSLIIPALSARPFSQAWRYDLAPEQDWRASPEMAPTVLVQASRPFAWVWWVGPVPGPLDAWAWSAPNATLILPEPGTLPFVPVYQDNYWPELNWYGPTAALLTRRIAVGAPPALTYPRQPARIYYPPT